MKEYDGFINLDFPDNDFVVYRIYSADETDNSIYIGLTENYKDRARKHALSRKANERINAELYRWMNNVIDNLEKKVLFSIIESNLSIDQANDRERYYIKKYKDEGYTILNSTEGGRWGKRIRTVKFKRKFTAEHLQRLSDSHKGQIPAMRGKRHSDDSIQLMVKSHRKRVDEGWRSPKRRKVYKYNKDGNLLIVYNSTKEAGIAEDCSDTYIGEKCRLYKNSPVYKNHIYSYNELPPEEVIRLLTHINQ